LNPRPGGSFSTRGRAAKLTNPRPTDEGAMDDTNKRNGEVLNWLLKGAIDSAEGFRQGATLARNPKFQALFLERAEQRKLLADQIAGEVRSFGEPSAEGGTVIGNAHRAFTYLRDSIGSDSDKGLIEELRRRERAIADKFQAAIEDVRLPPRPRSVATAAFPPFVEAANELAAIGQQLADGEGPAAAPRFKLTDDDARFLEVPAGAAVLSAGASGTESWIERPDDCVVRIGIQAVAVATAAGGALAVTIEVGDAASTSRDGPAPIEAHLAATQSVEVLVKAGAGIRFKATATAENAQVLRTVVWSANVVDPPLATDEAAPAAPAVQEVPVVAPTGDIVRTPLA